MNVRTFQGPSGPLWRFHLILFNYLKSQESFRLPKSVWVVWPRAVSICDITWPSIWIIPNVECNNRSWLPNFFQVSPCQALPPKLHVSQLVKVFFFLCLCWNYTVKHKHSFIDDFFSIFMSSIGICLNPLENQSLHFIFWEGRREGYYTKNAVNCTWRKSLGFKTDFL